MANFAKLDSNNVVVEVNVVNNAVLDSSNEEASGVEFLTSWSRGHTNWVQTSYNASSSGFRKQYAGIGYTYDSTADVFIAPKPFASWTLDSNHDWQPPTPRPTEGKWAWNEEELEWVAI